MDKVPAPSVPTAEQRRRQRQRSLAIGIGIGVLVTIFYIITVFKLGTPQGSL